MNMRLELRMVAEDEEGHDVCAAHARNVNEGGHAWMYNDPEYIKALAVIGMTEDMLKVCTLCNSRPCPRERCPLWDKGKRSPREEELERLFREGK